MNIPSGRILCPRSPGYLFLERLEKNNKPIIALDAEDAVTAKLISLDHPDYFEGFWISSLGTSLRMGFEDAYTLSPRDYSQIIKDIQLVAPNQFIVVDADNGGQSHKNTRYAYNLYSTLGVSIAFIENKSGVKFNSLAQSRAHTLENKESFAAKVKAAKSVQNKTLVGIRLENAVVSADNPQKALSDTLDAARYFMDTAKPDFFLFHWTKETCDLPIEFANRYLETFNKEPQLPYLACIPTTYSKNVTNTQLGYAGYRLIILGNPVLRAQIKAIQETAKAIVKSDSLKDVDQSVLSIIDLMRINTDL